MVRGTLVVAVLALLGACRFGAARQPGAGVDGRVPRDTMPLPAIPVYEIAEGGAGGGALAPSRSRDPLAGISSARRVTLTTSNADVRTLLIWLAEQAGVSLVVAPDVNARVTVSFRDVPVVEAMRAVLAEARLSVLVGPLQAPWPPVVFYQLPVNVNTASAEAISARFGVSMEMARFIVESRVRP